MRIKQILLALMMFTVFSGFIFAATVSGKVSYTGALAKRRAIDMSAEPSCAKQHSTPVTTETVVTGANNGLANVVVYVSSGALDEGQVPSQAVTLEQKGCQYVPHVVAIHTGQELKIVNNDQTSHNIHPLARSNHEWNKSQPPGAQPISDRYDKEEFIPVKCNVHPWMHGWVAVLKTNHHDISREDGTFKLPNLPPGNYTLTAWHESYGTQKVDVSIGAANEIKEVNFSFKAKP